MVEFRHDPQLVLHEPPAESTTNVYGGSVTQNGPAGWMYGLLPPPGVTIQTNVIVTGLTQGVSGVPVAT